MGPFFKRFNLETFPNYLYDWDEKGEKPKKRRIYKKFIYKKFRKFHKK